MIYKTVQNIPKNPREIYDFALTKSYHNWIDEKGTENHPDVWQRQPSDLSFDTAWDIIQNNKPHWVISYRDMEYLTDGRDESYWEFGGCNIASNEYGEVFIWICVSIEEAEKIFKKFQLNIRI